MQFSPKRITGAFQPIGGPSIQFSAFMDGTFLDIEYNEDAVTAHIGSQGDVTAVLNANKTAKLVATFVQGSPTNDQLSIYVPDARLNYLPTGVVSIRDLNGNSVVTGAGAWIQKMAKVSFGKEVAGREWTFFLPDAIIIAGGDNS